MKNFLETVFEFVVLVLIVYFVVSAVGMVM